MATWRVVTWPPLFARSPTYDSCEDASAAPGAYRGPRPLARRYSFARARQNMFWVYAFGLVFLVFAVAAGDDDGSAVVALSLSAVIAVGYLGAAWAADASLRWRWAYLSIYVAVIVATASFWGWNFLNFAVYVAIMTATLIPWGQARIAVVGLGLLLLVAAMGQHDLGPAYLALIAVGIALGVGAGIESGRIAHKLARAEQQVSTLAVAAERERIARDLHDILGHSLTAVAIKAGLAARLVEHDPAAAREQLAEVEAVARQALADVRATASGYREVRVAGEIASARSVLSAAGIEARLPTAVPALPEPVAELFGWVVREAVTNVVRHSHAHVCTITLEPDAVRVSDDGDGLPPGPSTGSGLTGLSLRVEQAGMELRLTSAPGHGTTVEAGPVRTPTPATVDQTQHVVRTVSR